MELHACIHTYMHTYIHTYIHTYVYGTTADAEPTGPVGSRAERRALARGKGKAT
jgi:hypothetical protein